MHTVGFIGYGRLAKALHQGLSQFSHCQCIAYSPSLLESKSEPWIMTSTKNVVNNADCIFLCVKPNKITNILREIKPYLNANKILVSVAAGVSLQSMQDTLSMSSISVFRMMPNLSVAVGKGVCILQSGAAANRKSQEIFIDIVKTLGHGYWVNNDADMNSLTALLGSGPAYVLEFMQALMDIGVKLGLSSQDLRQWILELITGTAAWAHNSDKSFKSLQEQVISPGGTTEAALNYLKAQHWDVLLQEAINLAYVRANELNNIKGRVNT